jgi:hypothetical protein
VITISKDQKAEISEQAAELDIIIEAAGRAKKAIQRVLDGEQLTDMERMDLGHDLRVAGSAETVAKFTELGVLLSNPSNALITHWALSRFEEIPPFSA